MICKVGIYYDPRKDRPHIVRWFGEPDLDGRQKRYSKSFERKRDAEAFRAEKMTAFQKGERRDRPKEVTLKDFCEDWLRIRGPSLRDGTKKLYRLTIDRVIAHFGATTPVSKVGPMAAEKFIANLRPERKEKQGKTLSAWTRQKMLRHCKTIFQKGVVWGLTPVNPFQEIRPFILLNEERYQTVLENWRRHQKDGRAWGNRDMLLNANRDFKRLVKKAGIKPTGSLSLHTLRKCAGKNWADALPPHVTKELMGHSTVATTMKYYVQVDDSQRTRAAAAVDALIAGAGDKTDAHGCFGVLRGAEDS
jgi:integrase